DGVRPARARLALDPRIADPARDAGAPERHQGSRGLPAGGAGRHRGARRGVVRRRAALAVHAVRVRRRRGQGGAHSGRAPRRRHRARADREPCSASALLRSALRVRAAHRCASAGEHVVQHARRADRVHAAGRGRVLLDIAPRRARDRLVAARDGGAVQRRVALARRAACERLVPAGEAGAGMPRVAVLVPSYERPAMLNRCLTALAAQELPGTNFEVIVVHDGPSETARKLVSQWAKKLAVRGGPRVRYHSPAHAGPAAARSAGWRLEAADIIAFTDAVTVPDPKWLVAALAAMKPDIDAAWGRIVVPLPKNPTDYEIDAARLSVSQFVTANCFCRKGVLERLGGFDE